MSKLIEYLEKYHLETSFEEIQDDFMEKFGVNVKQEDDLFQFKYNMIAAKWIRDVTWECRGAILRRRNGEWYYCARPFDKFFNQSEGNCPYFQEEAFNKHIGSLSLWEKMDGTCIEVWYDDIRNTFRASTLGCITPSPVQDFDFNFDELFWKTLLGSDYEKEIPNLPLERTKTYIFELCCTENRILTKYPANIVALLSVRENQYGLYDHKQNLEDLTNDWVKRGWNIRLPYTEYLVANGIENLEQMKLFVSEASTCTDMFGEYPEGFVIYEGTKPVCKMKNATYIAMHHVSGGDTLHTRNVVIASFFEGSLDDIYSALVDNMKEYADSLKEKVNALFTRMQKGLREIQNKEFKDRKQYALTVQAVSEKQFWPFFFQKQSEILDKENDVMQLFTDWISLNYAKFMDYWKSRESKSSS